jgi:hypothetical protein
MILQKLIGNIYSAFMEILLWIIPILCIIVGILSATDNLPNAFLGFILGLPLGLLLGLILDVILFGPVIILFNIRTSLKNIENK